MIDIVRQDIEAYAFQHTSSLPPVLEELRQYTYAEIEDAGMISDQLIGTLLQCLIHISGAKRVLELGTFTGFSSLMMAHALPDDGKVITCDIDPRAREMVVRYSAKTPHGKKIEVRIGPALETLKALTGPFDLVFIDADKTNYVNYYERCMELLTPRGIIVADNALWSGRVLNPQDEDGRAIATFNDHVKNDARVKHVLLTIRDGLMLIRRHREVPSGA